MLEHMKLSQLLFSVILFAVGGCNLGAEEWRRQTSPDGCLDAVLMDEHTDALSADVIVLYIVSAGTTLSTRALYPDRDDEMCRGWPVAGEVLAGSRFRDPEDIWTGPGFIQWNGNGEVHVRYRSGTIYHFRSRSDVVGSGDCQRQVEIRLQRVDANDSS